MPSGSSACQQMLRSVAEYMNPKTATPCATAVHQPPLFFERLHVVQSSGPLRRVLRRLRLEQWCMQEGKAASRV